MLEANNLIQTIEKSFTWLKKAIIETKFHSDKYHGWIESLSRTNQKFEQSLPINRLEQEIDTLIMQYNTIIHHLEYGEIKKGNQRIKLTADNIEVLEKENSFNIQKQIAHQKYQALSLVEEVAQILIQIIDKRKKIANLKGFDCVLTERLQNCDIPISFYNRLMNTVNANKNLFLKFIDEKKEKYNIELHPWNLFSLQENQKELSLENSF